MTWIWVQAATVYAVHDKQLSVHGGLSGVRDCIELRFAAIDAINFMLAVVGGTVSEGAAAEWIRRRIVP